MDLRIFDVEHGACALLTCDDNTRLMIDCGHNGSTKWYPGDHLVSNGIASLDMLAITNYDEDHVSGIENLTERVDVKWLLRNKGVETRHLKHLKSDTGMGPGIAHLCHLIDGVYSGGSSDPRPSFSGLTYSVFYHAYPTFDDENNLSLVLYLECNGIGVMFTGDLEKAGWLKMLERQAFREALAKTRVLVAPHHGREGGCCEEAMKLCTSLNYVVISDKGYQHDTQQTVPFYRRFARGGPFREEEKRRVLTTRRDGRIGFDFRPGGWNAY